MYNVHSTLQVELENFDIDYNRQTTLLWYLNCFNVARFHPDCLSTDICIDAYDMPCDCFNVEYIPRICTISSMALGSEFCVCV